MSKSIGQYDPKTSNLSGDEFLFQRSNSYFKIDWDDLSAALNDNIGNTDLSLDANRTLTLNGFDFKIAAAVDTNLLFVNRTTERIGIGDPAPSEKFHVAGTARVNTSLGINDAAPTEGLFVKSTGTGAEVPFEVEDSAGAVVIHAKANRTIGFGTDTITGRWHFKHDVNGNSVQTIDNSTNGTGAAASIDILSNSGGFAITAFSTLHSSKPDKGRILCSKVNGVEIDSNAGGQIEFRISGSEAARFHTNGFLGLGDTAPANRLDCNGDANVTGVYKVDDTQVVSNRVTGWTDQTAAASRADLGGAPTVGALASFCRALYDDLKSHGLIGN